MGKKLYVGNLSYKVTDGTLEQMFAAHGTVESAQVIMDRDTGRSKGFGFVEMGSQQEAQAAIAALNGQQVGGRSLTVNEAKPREERGGGGGRGGFGGGRGGGGGGFGGRHTKPGLGRVLSGISGKDTDQSGNPMRKSKGRHKVGRKKRRSAGQDPPPQVEIQPHLNRK